MLASTHVIGLIHIAFCSNAYALQGCSHIFTISSFTNPRIYTFVFIMFVARSNKLSSQDFLLLPSRQPNEVGLATPGSWHAMAAACLQGYG